ncbi:MAG TPA: NINE protein [Gemmata sp.]
MARKYRDEEDEEDRGSLSRRDDDDRGSRSRRFDDDDGDYDDDRGRAPARRRRVQEFASKKIVAGILGILLGGLGIHKFVLGFPTAGAIMLVTTLVTAVIGAFCILPWLATFALSVIGLVEGIIYLTKSDEDFYQTYAVEQRSWF